ncbi:MAG TPA: hypothetical protein VFK94_06980, partial [Patescibacteria group bacterium]|nr:hypothetical protein [Patescibacteria group bacterium]
MINYELTSLILFLVVALVIIWTGLPGVQKFLLLQRLNSFDQEKVSSISAKPQTEPNIIPEIVSAPFVKPVVG